MCLYAYTPAHEIYIHAYKPHAVWGRRVSMDYDAQMRAGSAGSPCVLVCSISLLSWCKLVLACSMHVLSWYNVVLVCSLSVQGLRRSVVV